LEELSQLYRTRGAEFSQAATAALSKQESGGVPFFYQAGLSKTGPSLREVLDRISDSARGKLRERMARTRQFDEQADKLTKYLGWLGLLIGFGAIVLGFMAYRAITERLVASADAENEAVRALALEQAVDERTRELVEANERLRAEAAEREAAEEKLRQAQKMDAIGQLTGGIAHDFNNMLAVVVGGIDLARRKLRGPKRDVEYHLDNAMEGASRAAALTRRLLAFARSEPLLPQAVAAGELVEGMLDLLDRSLGERIQVETRFPREPWFVWADRSQLENAVLNLCVNGATRWAAKASSASGSTMSACTATRSANSRPATMSGSASPIQATALRPSISSACSSPSSRPSRSAREPGLGLSQIFGFARQSGGDVAIDSTVGAGTTVSLYLPRSLRAADAGLERGGGGAGDEPAPAPAGTVILVVEDDPRVSRSTVGSLEELGYHPIACGSGAEALDILAHRPDVSLLITDVMMPEMTGPELVRIASARYPDVAVLFVTGYVGEAGEADDMSGYDMLRKPFTVAALRDAVAAALAHRVSARHPASASEAAE
jgi:signal transduction histidine kinase/CheY-like chemotaxis protein